VFNISLDRLLETFCSLQHMQPKDHHKCVSLRHNHAVCVYILPYNIPVGLNRKAMMLPMWEWLYKIKCTNYRPYSC